MKTGPRYIGNVNYASIVAHIEKLSITAQYKIKMNPVDFGKLVLEYNLVFGMDFKTVMRISGIPVEVFEATPINRVCVVDAHPDSSVSCAI